VVLGQAVRDITLVLPHFQNLGMLAEQQKVWATYPSALRAHLHIVIVDDCSPAAAAPTAESIVFRDLASIRLYRLLTKARWNWLACRNLGAEQASTDWLLMTDIDHVVPTATLQALMTRKLRADDAHRFGRVTAERPWPYDVARLPKYKPHNDSWFLARTLFFDDRVGGYDERLAGCYGTSSEFSARLTAAARAHVLLNDCVLVRYPREVIADASTSPEVYTRKNDPENDAELKRRRLERDAIERWRPLRGSFPSERLL
jgi:hypothetical protein